MRRRPGQRREWLEVAASYDVGGAEPLTMMLVAHGRRADPACVGVIPPFGRVEDRRSAERSANAQPREPV